MSVPEKMRAAVLSEPEKMEPIEVPTPPLQEPDSVLLKVEVVGVCGSDVHYFKEGRIGDQVVEYPYRVGHEFSARVVSVGPRVSSLRIGDRVAVDPAIHCGKCSQCLEGRSHTCEHLLFLGCPGQVEGCLAEYITMPEKCCFPVPDSLSFEEAALVEPLSIGFYALRLSNPLKNRKLGILGCGPIGLCVLLPALASKPAGTFVTDKIDARLEVARQAGAHWTGNPVTEDVVSEILEREPKGLDVVFECCGRQEALDQAIKILKPGGKLMIIGIPSENRVSFNAGDMRRKEIQIQNVRRQNECVQPAIDFIARGNAVDFLITHEFSLAETQRAFDLVSHYRDGVVKAMIYPGR